MSQVTGEAPSTVLAAAAWKVMGGNLLGSMVRRWAIFARGGDDEINPQISGCHSQLIGGQSF